MGTIVPLIKQLSKRAQLANDIEAQLEYANAAELAQFNYGLSDATNLLNGLDFSFGLPKEQWQALLDNALMQVGVGAELQRVAQEQAGMFGETYRLAMEDAIRPGLYLARAAANAEAALAPVRSVEFPNLARYALDAADLNGNDVCLVPRPRERRRAFKPVDLRKPLTRAELEEVLEKRDEQLILRLQAQLQTRNEGIVTARALPARPPIPDNDVYTWDDVFDWFYAVPRSMCLNLHVLAVLTAAQYGTVKNHHSLYAHARGLARGKKRMT